MTDYCPKSRNRPTAVEFQTALVGIVNEYCNRRTIDGEGTA